MGTGGYGLRVRSSQIVILSRASFSRCHPEPRILFLDVILSRAAAKERNINGRTCMPYHVYIMANDSFALYIGVTRDLHRRVCEHRNPIDLEAYTNRHRIFKLVYFESTDNVAAAIAREKAIKGWRRARKVALIASSNPEWRDLASDWYVGLPGTAPSLRSG
jgi:putative endonuclease